MAARNPTCPFATQRILHGNEDRRPTIDPIGTALHTAVTRAHGLQLGDYFDQESVVDDSTFYVDEDGGLFQFNPVNRKANAQFSGNAFRVAGRLCGMVSIETWDGGNPSTPLNDRQLATLARLYAWLHLEWGISLEVSTAWNGPGAGWHAKYAEWNHNAHQCPGDVRVRQLLDVVLPAARRLVNPSQQEGLTVLDDETRKYLDMQFGALDAKVDDVAGEVDVLRNAVKGVGANGKGTSELGRRLDSIDARLAKLDKAA